MKLLGPVLPLWGFILAATLNASAQGAFQNFAFENPIPPLTPVNFQVPTTNALPGWTAYAYGNPLGSVVYNTISIGAAAVSLQGPGSLEPVIQGSYTVMLQGSSGGAPGSAAIGQTGLIPISAQSIIFWGSMALDQVSFNGQTLPLFVAGTTPNFKIYQADVSGFAGQTGQLLFNAPPGFTEIIDAIHFSSTPAPEPSGLALVALGTTLFGLHRWRRRT